ncbi:unnamed protein product [Closterium sp. Yama58-4]|nr:unnamed protein product [Closterium sp. Yama58-4]
MFLPQPITLNGQIPTHHHHHHSYFATSPDRTPSVFSSRSRVPAVRRQPVIARAQSDGSDAPPTQTPPPATPPPATFKSSQTSQPATSQPAGTLELVGEDAAVFSIDDQKTSSWAAFFGVLGVVMAILYVIWIDPDTGFGGAYIGLFESISDSREIQMLLMLLVFAIVHSGGAALRPAAERVIGERAYRVLFAGISLPLAVSAVVFFINHRYDGFPLWQLRGVVGMHEFVWALAFVSFFFLYPSTFNLLEVAAVDKPKLHMWETGIMRITRHPQMTGQLLWCVAHMLWIGSSFTAVTSLGLLLHHMFGVWHGDQRLEKKYGEAFDEVRKRTSIVPFAAILDGRQQLPPDYYKEFLRVPYLAITAMTIGAYFCHPLMIQASFWLHW